MMTSILREIQRRVDRRVGAVLERVIGPQHLRAVRHGDHLVGLPSRMGAGEARMAGRVPILGREGVGDGPGEQAVDRRHDGLAVGHGKLASGHERGLHVHDAQDVGRGIDPDHGLTLRGGLAAGGGVLSG